MNTKYDVFHRTWWKDNPSWPYGLEPRAGKKTYFAKGVSWSLAKEICREWNSEHKPGRLSRRAEFEESE